MNFYSPVASVQTGHQSVANVSQTINPDVSATLRDVLAAIEQHIERLDTLPGYSKTEIIEIVRESNVRLHDLKHTAYSLMRKQGAAVDTIARVAGNSDMKMAMRYENFGPSLTKDAVNRLDELWNSASQMLHGVTSLEGNVTIN